MIDIRPLKKEDIAFLVSARETFFDAWDENMLNSAFRAGNFYGFIAEEKSGSRALPTGFITYSVNIDTADLQDLFVAGAFRRQGIAKRLLEAFILDAGRKKLQKLFLEVRAGNIPAINLYKAYGFKFLSERKKYYPDGENAEVYVKEL